MLIQPILIAIKESGQCWQYRGTEKEIGVNYVYHDPRVGPLGMNITVKPGFRTDGASSPKILWTLTGFLPRGIYDPAALVHDQLYTDKGYHNGQRYTRKQADRTFYRMMKECGVMRWHAWGAYIAVRIGGWYHWNRK